MRSVCIATYNGEKYLLDQLKSILDQLNDRDEIIIVDDCSSDRTSSIIEGLKDNRITMHVNDKNLGVIRSFEKAIALSRGDIIYLADQDDLWLPGKVNEMERILKNSKEKLLMTNAYIFDEKSVWLATFFEHRKSRRGLWTNIVKNSFIGCCIAFRADLKSEILPFPKNIPMHDQWIGLISEINGGILLESKPYISYRRHSENITGMTPGNFLSIFIKRVNILSAILGYLIRRRI